jgi:flagellar basal-body rod modification protein FlgD
MIAAVGDSANELRTNFLNLLVAQLKYQDPLEPMNNTEMTSQLAQISQVQQLETMNGAFQAALGLAQKQQAAALIGKQVTFKPEGSDILVTGRVTAVDVASDGVCLRVGPYSVPLANIESIEE